MSTGEALRIALRGETVPAAVLEGAFAEIADGAAPPVRVAGLLVALRVKGETVDEIVAVARCLRERAVRAPLADPRTLDTCGTGGDDAGTFNISTASALVVAGAGLPVAKHGNRAISSRAGSIDVLEALGVRVELGVEESARLLREVGFAPFPAPVAHPALRAVGAVRRELGVRTLMNCLGPLLNPVGVRRQLVGVYEARLVTPLAEALGRLGAEAALVVHGDDGLDELTTTTTSRAALFRDGAVRELVVDPEALGLARARPADLAGGDPERNAAILTEVLAGKSGPRRDVVLLNAAAALWVGGAADDLEAGITLAARSLDSGAARERLAALVRATGGGATA